MKKEWNARLNNSHHSLNYDPKLLRGGRKVMGRFLTNTVKPALVTTCLQRPPIYKDHIFCFP